MKKKTILTVVIGTALLFMWNAISWMVLPFHTNTLKNIPENVFSIDTLKKEMPKSGVYHYPGLPKDNSKSSIEQVEKKLRDNPRITLMVYKNAPTKLFNLTTFLYSLLINFFTALLMLLVVSKIAIKKPKPIFTTTILTGIITFLVGDANLMNWYMFPLYYILVNVLDKIISFTLLATLFSKYTFRK